MKQGFCIALATIVCLGGCTSNKKPEPEKPLVVMVRPMDVPEAVTAGFNRFHPGASITEVSKEVYENGGVVYVVSYGPQGDRQARLTPTGTPAR